MYTVECFICKLKYDVVKTVNYYIQLECNKNFKSPIKKVYNNKHIYLLALFLKFQFKIF